MVGMGSVPASIIQSRLGAIWLPSFWASQNVFDQTAGSESWRRSVGSIHLTQISSVRALMHYLPAGIDVSIEALHILKSCVCVCVLIKFVHSIKCSGRSQWLCGLRRGPAAAVLLALQVQIPVGSMDVCLNLVSVLCCQVEVSAKDCLLAQSIPTKCGVSYCVWLWSLNSEEAVTHYGLFAMEKKLHAV
jgi:hypothetical protein